MPISPAPQILPVLTTLSNELLAEREIYILLEALVNTPSPLPHPNIIFKVSGREGINSAHKARETTKQNTFNLDSQYMGGSTVVLLHWSLLQLSGITRTRERAPVSSLSRFKYFEEKCLQQKQYDSKKQLDNSPRPTNHHSRNASKAQHVFDSTHWRPNYRASKASSPDVFHVMLDVGDLGFLNFYIRSFVLYIPTYLPTEKVLIL
jgi:hypothetical protein